HRVPNFLVGGTGKNEIHGSPYADFILASLGGGGPDDHHTSTIYSSEGDDTITGVSGKDTFVVPVPVADADIVLTADPDRLGNLVPAVKFKRRSDPVSAFQKELIHVRGINQIGVEASAGDNNISVAQGSQVVYHVKVTVGLGNNLINLGGF